MSLQIKSELCKWIIIKEWIENGEFSNTERIIVIGTKWQAIMVNILFRGSGKKVYYATEPNEKYHYRKRTKWIIFDRYLKSKLPQNTFDVLFIPKL